ncbi:MAG TPA: biotin/lipoyl-binding protein [Thermoanaerobacterales bacterium]|nr:biotin/lipoyl-binding protein [Thermoanaerobacterales bacterium]
MKKKFKITVNGETYEVDVEEICCEEEIENQPRTQEPSLSHEQAKNDSMIKTPVITKRPILEEGGTEIKAPMPGIIVSVNVKPGDEVTKGQVLMILEAMKMENEIMSPASGQVSSVNVVEGASVNTGDILIVIGAA